MPISPRIQQWVNRQFDEQVAFLQKLVQMPTDTPPGDNAPHAELVASLVESWGWEVERHPVDAELVSQAGMQSVTNLVIRRRYGPGPTLALNAHGDVVPPGDGWTYPPYGGEIHDGRLYGRAAAVSKSDFATYLYAISALEACTRQRHGSVELHFTYDEEFGGLLGPGWLLARNIVQPDWAICAGFGHSVVLAHNGCLQFEVVLHGKATHGAQPHTGHDALRAANRLLTALYDYADSLSSITSKISGITSPTLIVGQVDGGTNTNVVPGKVVLKIDRRLIPEEDPVQVEKGLRALIHNVVEGQTGIRVDIQRLLFARALQPLPGHEILVSALQQAAQTLYQRPLEAVGTPLYADARLYAQHGVPVVLYGAGPRTLIESNAKRADEHVVLDDLRQATSTVACAAALLLQAA